MSVLYAANARSGANATDLRLLATVGSPADQILTLVALPHTTQHVGADDAGPDDVEAEPELPMTAGGHSEV